MMAKRAVGSSASRALPLLRSNITEDEGHLECTQLSTGTVQETDRSAPATGRRTDVQDQDGRCRAADLALSAGPRRSQAAGADCRSKTTQSQASLPGHEGSPPASRSPRWRGGAAP